jgi:hypothetical protein
MALVFIAIKLKAGSGFQIHRRVVAPPNTPAAFNVQVVNDGAEAESFRLVARVGEVLDH